MLSQYAKIFHDHYERFHGPKKHYHGNHKPKELCKAFDLQTSLLSGRYPHRVWEGKGYIRFLSRRSAELSCDFQQPKNIISNVIWHKAANPRVTSNNLYEKRAPNDGLFNNGFLLYPFNYPKIYALNRPAGSSLFIHNVSPRDFGTYRCFATRFATPFTYKYPQLITVYQDIEFYPRHLQYEVFEK
ncbi:uncharacterized protein [Hetaerina americana]|uniref:uncharacterized protein n=1 Tax=Hetaerina americana TaxID=62018 RepID=UPI003A7F335F